MLPIAQSVIPCTYFWYRFIYNTIKFRINLMCIYLFLVYISIIGPVDFLQIFADYLLNNFYLVIICIIFIKTTHSYINDGNSRFDLFVLYLVFSILMFCVYSDLNENFKIFEFSDSLICFPVFNDFLYNYELLSAPFQEFNMDLYNNPSNGAGPSNPNPNPNPNFYTNPSDSDDDWDKSNPHMRKSRGEDLDLFNRITDKKVTSFSIMGSPKIHQFIPINWLFQDGHDCVWRNIIYGEYNNVIISNNPYIKDILFEEHGIRTASNSFIRLNYYNCITIEYYNTLFASNLSIIQSSIPNLGDLKFLDVNGPLNIASLSFICQADPSFPWGNSPTSA